MPPAAFPAISGVAPCASIRSYRVCQTNNCADADIEAGIDSVLIHGDCKLMSFSISGGDTPWSDNDRDFLDVVDSGVLVAASAGNTSRRSRSRWPGEPSWSVGAYGGRIHQGPGSPQYIIRRAVQAVLRRKPRILASEAKEALRPIAVCSTIFQSGISPVRISTSKAAMDEPPFPANFFKGAIAFIRRGNCAFTEKITNAFNQGKHRWW